uniref:CSON015379 protein n=1 Tax=Culicoides sonorensis TaxID=179676 RepID=A0A336KUE2_CULSO
MGGPKYKRIQKEDPDSGQHFESNERRNSHNGNTSNHNNNLKETEKVQIITTANEFRTNNGNGIRKRDLMCYNTCITIAVITSYFVLSITLTFYNQWIFKSFKYPLLVTSYHLVIKLILSAIVRILYRLKTGKSRVLLDWRTSVMKIAPTGLCAGIDIGFSSWGLELVTVSLYTMTKSTTIIFILIFAIMLGLEKKSWILLLIVAMISGGLSMFTYKSTQFNTIGFCLILFAAFMSGFRWSLAQLIMQKSKLGLHNPVDMVYHMQPWMIMSILPVTLIFEGRKILDNSDVFNSVENEIIIEWLMKLSIGAFVAFIMELSEFLTLSYTSSLTLSVVGIFKEICQLVLAVEFNHDQLTLINVFGLTLCLGGICCHVLNKYWNYVKIEDESGTVCYETYTRPTRQSDGEGCSSGGAAPLLESDNLDFSDSDSQNEDTSNVIYDILKRRDPTR